MNAANEAAKHLLNSQIVHPHSRSDPRGGGELVTLSALGVGTTRLHLLAALCCPESLFFLLPPQSSSTLRSLASFFGFNT